MEIQLSDHFTYKRLIRFVLPSIGMMIFTSIYGVVDGLFISNFAGKTEFASINLIMPFLMVFSAVGFMVGTGGTALVSKKLGEGDEKKANSYFSLLVYLIIITGAVLTAVSEIFLSDVAKLLGATDEMLPFCVKYGRIISTCLVPFMLQSMFQSFLVAAEKPRIGLFLTIAAGVTNMVLDALLVGYFRLGVAGAAVATAISQAVGGIIPLVYFFCKNTSRLRLGKTKWNGKVVLKTCTNGASEFMVNVSMSLVNMLYNMQLLKFIGEDGVSAYGIIMYVNFIFVSVYVGYSIGTAPLVGFNYGAKNHGELHNLLTKSLKLICGAAVVMTASALLLAKPLAKVFVGYDESLTALTTRAFAIYSVAFLFMGFNIFGSSFFTALNNGAVSAAISFLRVLLFQAASVIILPLIFGTDGIWASIIVAEFVSLIVTSSFIIGKRKHYGY